MKKLYIMICGLFFVLQFSACTILVKDSKDEITYKNLNEDNKNISMENSGNLKYEILDNINIYNENIYDEKLDDFSSDREYNFRLDINEYEIKYIQNDEYQYYVIDEEKKEISISKILNVSETVVIPDKIDGYNVVAIGILCDYFEDEPDYEDNYDYAVIPKEDSKNLINIYIPEGVKYIGRKAFTDMEQLKTISLPNSLHKIFEYAFINTGIEELELPINLVYISSHSFLNCLNLKKIIIHSKKLFYDDEYPPFSGCNNLTEVIWDNNVEFVSTIGIRLNHMKKIVIPPQVKEVDRIFGEKMIITGSETNLQTWEFDYAYSKDYYVIVPKDSVIIDALKQMHVLYEEVELPEPPNVTAQTIEEEHVTKTTLTWDKQNNVDGYEIYYSETKDGIYNLIDETKTTTYTVHNHSGFIVIRCYKVYQEERWYSKFVRLAL